MAGVVVVDADESVVVVVAEDVDELIVVLAPVDEELTLVVTAAAEVLVGLDEDVELDDVVVLWRA